MGDLFQSLCKVSKQQAHLTFWEKNKPKCATLVKMRKSGSFHRPFLAVLVQYISFGLISFVRCNFARKGE